MAEKRLLPGYLIIGADEVKRDIAVGRLKARLEMDGMADFNLDERDMTKEQDVDSLISSLNTFPMDAPFRLVILYGCDRLAKPMSEMLVDYFGDPAPTTVCLVIATSLSRSTRLHKAVSALGAQALIDCATKKRWELPGQVQSMMRRHGKTMTRQAAEELVGRSGLSTRMLDNELKKLARMTEAPEIGVADVERLVMRTAEVQPWDLLDALSARDIARSIELYQLMPSNSDIRLYALIAGRLRELICAKALDARGHPRDLARELGVQAWQVKNHIRWSRGFAMIELLDALRAAVRVELALKGSRDSRTALLRWIAQIAGEAASS
ncbi:DNA polymerase III, delta subunit [Coriobacterium glomerans PW2]|uniref:DNA-directed DNA polymerase n=1 Tax=Coriobacterium glomerans (strain ATCC 49209 / DSM 20642 / JCM 10262 / PW2) TaxID=700015 RepID=F2N7P5_CORGP|nr:DNA polymerase III subunit delta [Coriobacterium glomerans]AEB06937.1 DNA polymerase III, delta subunit [Coriobacterium glomerans PW2]